MPILIRLAPYAIIVAIATYFYFSYTSMESTIEKQAKQIETLKNNEIENAKKCKKEIQTQKLKVKWKTKKIYIEKNIKKDTDEKHTKPSNRFYLD